MDTNELIRRAEQELADGRRSARTTVERARRELLKQRDTQGLEQLLDLAGRLDDGGDLTYAIQQNLRLLARQPQPQDTAHRPYAAWGQRFAAWVFDGVIVLGSIWGLATAAAFAVQDAVTGILMVLVLAFLSPLYYAFLHAGKRGQTFGKRALGIAVRNQKTLGRISLGRSLARTYLVALVLAMSWAVWQSIILLFVDGLWPLLDAKHQTLHDKVAASVVVRV